MHNESKDNSSRRRRRRRSSSKPTKRDFTKFTGIGLVIFGITMCMWSFGMLDNPSELFQAPDYASLLQLWPLFIVLAGFAFLIKDYFKKESNQKWDS